MGKIAIAVDFVLFTIDEEKIKVLLVKRAEEPFMNKLALPGVAVLENESLSEAAKRCLLEETGITDDIYMEQLFTWGDQLDRDPRERVISVSFLAMIPRERINETAGLRVHEIGFFDMDFIEQNSKDIAFDHKDIIIYGRERIRNKARYTTIPFHFLPEKFSLAQAQRVYEIMLGKSLYKANFRKDILKYVEETGQMRKDGACRPSKLYKRNDTQMEESYVITRTV